MNNFEKLCDVCKEREKELDNVNGKNICLQCFYSMTTEKEDDKSIVNKIEKQQENSCESCSA